MTDLPGVFLISGVPGAGKTTVARMLAERFPRAAHIGGDIVGHHFIVSGFVAPQEEPREEAERQVSLRRRNVSMLADSYFEAGFVPVIDDVVISPGELAGYHERLRSRPIMFVMLAPSLEVVRRRDAARSKHVFEIWGHLDAEMRAMMPRVGLWIDTSKMTAEETVEEILARAPAEGIVS